MLKHRKENHQQLVKQGEYKFCCIFIKDPTQSSLDLLFVANAKITKSNMMNEIDVSLNNHFFLSRIL